MITPNFSVISLFKKIVSIELHFFLFSLSLFT